MATKIEGAKRSNQYTVDPDSLVLITDPEHELYDPRVELPVSDALVQNIMLYGVLQPIIVRNNGGVLEVVDGRQRTKAVCEANRRLRVDDKEEHYVKVNIQSGTSAQLFGITVAANEMRQDDSIRGKAEKARRLKVLGRSVKEVAITFGVTEKTVYMWAKMERLCEAVLSAIDLGQITATAACEWADLTDKQQKAKLKAALEEAEPGKAVTGKAAKAVKDSDGDGNSGPKSPKVKMKTRKEIMAEIENTPYATAADKAKVAALEWVLGLNMEGETVGKGTPDPTDTVEAVDAVGGEEV